MQSIFERLTRCKIQLHFKRLEEEISFEPDGRMFWVTYYKDLTSQTGEDKLQKQVPIISSAGTARPLVLRIGFEQLLISWRDEVSKFQATYSLDLQRLMFRAYWSTPGNPHALPYTEGKGRFSIHRFEERA